MLKYISASADSRSDGHKLMIIGVTAGLTAHSFSSLSCSCCGATEQQRLNTVFMTHLQTLTLFLNL